jgi:hypothetical protein
MLGRLIRKRFHRQETIQLILRDLVGRRGPIFEARRHLEAAAQWILRAQEATPDDGMSAGYSFEDGWIASYPETSGYTIPTLLAYGEYAAAPLYRERALATAEWELGLQLESGGFPGHFVDHQNPPVVFNTGQIIFGLLAAFEASGDVRFLAAGRRAGRWLVQVQDGDGAWRRFDYLGCVHSYNTRTAWALAELAIATGDDAFLAAARRNLDWACDQQQANGWFEHSSFFPDLPPFLHTIAYASQGLLEAGLRLQSGRYLEAAMRTCRAVLATVRSDGWIPGAFDRHWSPAASYSCLTGNAQMAAQWFRLSALSGDGECLDGALRTMRFLKSLQDCTTANRNVRGALKGSHPIWGGYLFGTYPNWATKFFMDALLLEEAQSRGSMACIRSW